MPILTNDSDRDWEAFGKRDPYYAVLSAPEYHGRLTGRAREEFFATGDRHVETILGIIREHLDAEFRPARAIDFGCGVGRIVIPLGRQCHEVVGVDVSPSMLDEARRNVEHAGCTNVRLRLTDEFMAEPASGFDFVHSYIVFQHIPTARGEQLIAALLDRLTKGGVAAIHVTYENASSPALKRALYWARTRIPGAHMLLNVVMGRAPGTPLMQGNEYSLSRVLDLFAQHGCTEVHLRYSNHQGTKGALLFAKKGSAPVFT